MKKLFEITVLIFYLFIIEHILLFVMMYIWDFIVMGRISPITETDLRFFTYQLFAIRIILFSIPLMIIFTIVTRNITLRNIFSLAILNMVSNITIIGLHSIFWFDGLIETQITTDALVITFISPFILNIFSFSKRWIQAAY